MAKLTFKENRDGMRQLIIDTTKRLNPDLTPEQLEETIARALAENGYK